jgi:hypothetical protein
MPKAPTGSCRGFSKRGIYHGPFNMPNHIRHHIRYVVPTCGALSEITVLFQCVREGPPSPLTSRHICSLSPYRRGRGASLALGSWCPPRFAPHYRGCSAIASMGRPSPVPETDVASTKTVCVISAERRESRLRNPAHTCLLRPKLHAVDVLSF